jgi:hypothetical protein
VEAEGVGELETKYEDSKKTLGLFQFLPSTLLPGRPLSHLLFCCPHTLGPHTSLGLCPCQPSLYPFQLFTQAEKEVYRILYSYPNTVKIFHTVLFFHAAAIQKKGHPSEQKQLQVLRRFSLISETRF